MFEPYRQAIAKELDVCFPADVPERVFLLRYEALQALRRQLDKYAADWIRPDLLDAIAAKKLAFLREARTKQQVKEILKFTPPRFDGNQYVPQSAYHVPEEELLYWSALSLEAPLPQEMFERFMALFQEIFPRANMII